MKAITTIAHVSHLLAVLQEAARELDRLAATTRGPRRDVDVDVDQASVRLKGICSELETDAAAELSIRASPIAAHYRASSSILKNAADAAAQVAVMPMEAKSKTTAMLERLKLSKKLSTNGSDEIAAMQARIKEQVEQVSKLLSPSLLEDAENEHHELSLLPRIDASKMATLQAASSSLRASMAILAGCASEAVQTLALHLESLIAKQQQAAALAALQFYKLHERFDSITTAETDTFAWLLPGDEREAALDDHRAAAKRAFLDWLDAGTGFFYVSGKPGAGKSTLMKFIYRSPEFYERAQRGRWADTATTSSTTLVLGRFFFWKPGRPTQKSVSGMLRGLLCSVLEAQPAIAAAAMPELCASLLTTDGDDAAVAAVSDEDVKMAFQNMLSALARSKKYALLLVVDGLDELEGDHGALLTLMQSWVSQYPSTVKICVSSREHGVFESFFAKTAKFRLHELTKDDMSLLVAARLRASPALARLLPSREESPDILGPLLVERAVGVFLWVVLAVSSLEDGAEAGDIRNAGELEGRARRFPSELDDFLPYVHKSVTEHSRPWAYKAMALARFTQFTVAELLSEGGGGGYPGVGLMEFMLMDEVSQSWNLTTFSPRSDSKTASVEERQEAARRKVLCRPRGFLAVSNLSHVRSWPANGTDKLYITFTHRSVVEFLESPPAAATMATYVGSFDPFLAMASSDLAALRFASPQDFPLLKDRTNLPPSESVELSGLLADALVQRLSELIQCALALQKAKSARFLSLLDAIGDAIRRHLTLLLPLQRVRLAVEDSSPHQILINLTLANHVFEYSEWKRKQPILDGSKKAMSAGLFHAFQGMIRRCRPANRPTICSRELQGGQLIPVINNTPGLSSSKVSVERLLKVLKEFFENGLEINWSWHGTWQGATTAPEDAWTCWQVILWAIVTGDIPQEEKHEDIVTLLFSHGASADMKIIAGIPKGPLQLGDLEPTEGWYLVSPFGVRTDKIGGKKQVGDATGRSSMLPAVLMHESSPVVWWAKQHDWTFTLRDLVTLKFGKDAGKFAILLGEEKS
ncbi:hypothetical protein ISF_01936 [Cordyceps fumosorosea ARSEF 2679]|uniref:Uncharacterized protein n=1 Tax=Cordyceps fumosorosea (strain ARSEF 2679) TaxID=1081104 RepID=A0A168CHL4_CORFA|nr:hypothetical protein ISF_01936 [Cordyceps fumosorosea ARSEF 2679]OAA71385.1 hypothetical protein ISF_01936 [Cordyceps fumosorosea ARSEF 2679]